MINLAAVQVVKVYKKWKNLAQKLYKKVLKFVQCLEKTECDKAIAEQNSSLTDSVTLT